MVIAVVGFKSRYPAVGRQVELSASAPPDEVKFAPLPITVLAGKVTAAVLA